MGAYMANDNTHAKKRQALVLAAAVIAVLCILRIFAPAFYSFSNISNILEQVGLIGILSGGVAFVLILFTERNDIYYMRFRELKKYYDRMAEGHPKNFKYVELEDEYFIKPKGPALVPYLDGINTDIQERGDADDE